jgi:hypothetical protein
MSLVDQNGLFGSASKPTEGLRSSGSGREVGENEKSPYAHTERQGNLTDGKQKADLMATGPVG